MIKKIEKMIISDPRYDNDFENHGAPIRPGMDAESILKIISSPLFRPKKNYEPYRKAFPHHPDRYRYCLPSFHLIVADLGRPWAALDAMKMLKLLVPRRDHQWLDLCFLEDGNRIFRRCQRSNIAESLAQMERAAAIWREALANEQRKKGKNKKGKSGRKDDLSPPGPKI